MRLLSAFLIIFISSNSLAETPSCQNVKSFIEQAVSNTNFEGNSYNVEYDRVVSCEDALLKVKVGVNNYQIKPFRVVTLEKEVVNPIPPNGNSLHLIQIPEFIKALSKLYDISADLEQVLWQSQMDIVHNSITFHHLMTLIPRSCWLGAAYCYGGLFDPANSHENLVVGGTGVYSYYRPVNKPIYTFTDFPTNTDIRANINYQFVNYLPSFGTGNCNGVQVGQQCLVRYPVSETYRSLFVIPLTTFETPTPTPTSSFEETPTPTSTPTPTPQSTINYEVTPTPTPEACENEEGEDSTLVSSTGSDFDIKVPLLESEENEYRNLNGDESEEKPIVKYEVKRNIIKVSDQSPKKEVDADPKPGKICTGDNRYDGMPSLADIARKNLNQSNYFRDLQLIGRSGIHACNLFAYSAAARYAWNLRERRIITTERYAQITGRTNRKKGGFVFSTPFAHQSYAAYKKRGFKCLARAEGIKFINKNKLKAGLTLIKTPPPAKKKAQGHIAICTDLHCFEASYSWNDAQKIKGYRGVPARQKKSFLERRNSFTHVCWLPEQEPQLNGI